MSVLIFANGDEPREGFKWIRGYLDEASVIIAADGGAQHLSKLDLLPDVVIGDQDSLDEDLENLLTQQSVEFVKVPVDKDESDLELALIYASRKQDGPIFVFGATGGRMDQTLSNVLLLSHPVLGGMEVYIMEPYQKSWMFENETTITGTTGDLLSLIPLWGEVHIESTDGLKWPLSSERLVPGPARGISNVLTHDEAKVKLVDGRLLCVHTSKRWKR
jgi:thiamine pyrophosphokinase